MDPWVLELNLEQEGGEQGLERDARARLIQVGVLWVSLLPGSYPEEIGPWERSWDWACTPPTGSRMTMPTCVSPWGLAGLVLITVRFRA